MLGGDCLAPPNSPGPGLRMKDEGQRRCCDYRFYQMCCFLFQSLRKWCVHTCVRERVCQVWTGVRGHHLLNLTFPGQASAECVKALILLHPETN